MSVPAQIAILLALTANLFDPVPSDRMTDAEHAVLEGAAKISAEICARFETADKLSDEDRKAIIEIARQALASFQPKPAAKPAPDPKAEKKPGVAAKAGEKPEPTPDVPAKPTPEAGAPPKSSAQAQIDPMRKPEAEAKEKS